MPTTTWRLTHPQGTHWWWNLSKDSAIRDLLIPVLNRHIVRAGTREAPSILNLSQAIYVQVFETPERISFFGLSVWRIPFRLQLRSNLTNCTTAVLNEARLELAAEPTRSLLQQSLTTPKEQIFVIMAFGREQLDSAYHGVVKPLGAEFAYRVIRIDEVQGSGRISEQILEHIAQSKIILAELSDERPNCYYETGYAHALGRELIFTIRKGEPKHFDLAGYRFSGRATEVPRGCSLKTSTPGSFGRSHRSSRA